MFHPASLPSICAAPCPVPHGSQLISNKAPLMRRGFESQYRMYSRWLKVERRRESGEIANLLGIVGAVKLIEVIAGRVKHALLEHNML